MPSELQWMWRLEQGAGIDARLPLLVIAAVFK
jgi:hypothetical protein